jgi:NAD(P)-dependent dehydrogenase (short-subunit alcohol dehydrogenase family)
MVGEPADVARAVLWLVDPDNSYVSGSFVTVSDFHP